MELSYIDPEQLDSQPEASVTGGQLALGERERQPIAASDPPRGIDIMILAEVVTWRTSFVPRRDQQPLST
eukprot:scaffold3346_cov313-Pinguiococcus_pyrenoidosus.AAC.11